MSVFAMAEFITTAIALLEIYTYTASTAVVHENGIKTKHAY